MVTDNLYQEAARAISRSRNALAFTGAGVSVASGIPDFRSPGGLWSRYDPQEVASDWALNNNPLEVWKFLLEAIRMISSADPNPAHESLARMEGMGFLKAVITQNIDNLHQRAGSRNVIEFHGGADTFYCHKCKKEYNQQQALAMTPDDIPWLCSRCYGVVRPGVVFFGEQIPEKALQQTQRLVMQADLILVAGTSGDVAPAGTLPRWVKDRGGIIIEINLGRTAFEGISDIRLDEPAETALPGILEALHPMRHANR
ncbi:NAD-dependent deacylase [Desulfonatronospira sp.]|uniref:SIR2 family NAD-dependent protein deacylase n=1 Tax=Desulfonatronospira sp. TaxID=1962951 RepID=UPI0025BC7DDD|nr:NAD-dependent deacylase [Desulfonatronospira sp.]